jgi:hypothetical protein
MSHKKTAIVIRAEQAWGRSRRGLLKDSYNVVAASLKLTRSLTATPLTLLGGDIRNRQAAQPGANDRSL